MPDNSEFDPVVDGSCGCGKATSLQVCGPFAIPPVNPDKGACHSHFVKTECEAPSVIVATEPAELQWDQDGNPVYSQQLSYQWQVYHQDNSWTDIPGANTRGLDVNATHQYSDTDTFRCVVSVEFGTTFGVSIDNQPVDAVGFPAVFQLDASWHTGGSQSEISNAVSVI